MGTGTFGYSMLAIGDSDFIRSATIPLLAAIEESLGEAPSSDAMPLAGFPEDTAARAAVSDFFLGVVFTWATTTLLDEVYKLKFQPALREWLERADDVVIWPKRMSPSFVSAVMHQDIGVMIVIALSAATSRALAVLSEQAVDLHRAGREWALDNPQALPVQLWTLDASAGTTGPEEFDTLAAALQRHA